MRESVPETKDNEEVKATPEAQPAEIQVMSGAEYAASIEAEKSEMSKSFGISDAEYQQNFEQEQKKKKKSNKIWIIIGVLFNIIALVTVFFVEKGNDGGEVMSFSKVLEVFKENYQWVILAVVAYLVIMLGDGVAYLNLIHCTTRRYRPGLSVKLGIVGRYYDNITPLATGGQPFQIYTLTKSGIKAAKASSIALSRYIIKQIIFTLVLVAVFIYTAIKGIPFSAESQAGEAIVRVFAYIGVFVTCMLPFFFLLVAINRNLGHGLMKIIIKFLSKIRIVKNYDKTLNKTMTEMDRFQRSVKYVFKRKRTLFLQIILAIIDTLVFTSIPYFVYRAFGCDGADWITIVSSYMYCLAAVAFFPTPGTAGAAEASFYVVFASFFTIVGKGQYVFWALITWRFFTYYIFILVGLLQMLIKYTVKVATIKRTAKAQAAVGGETAPVENAAPSAESSGQSSDTQSTQESK